MKRITLWGAAIVLCAVMVSSTPNHAAAAQCKPKFASYGNWVNVLAARSSARRNWRRGVKRMYGRKYVSWFRARGKRYHCRRKALKRRCLVVARPCR